MTPVVDVDHHLTAPLTMVLLPLSVAWLMSIGLAACADALGQSRFTVAEGDDRWVDVSADAESFHNRSRRPRTGRILRVVGAALMLWFGVLLAQTLPWFQVLALVTVLLWFARRGSHLVALVIALALGVAAAWGPLSGRIDAMFWLAASACAYIIGRRWTDRRYPSYRTATDRPTIDDWLVPRHYFVWTRRRSEALFGSFIVLVVFAAVIYTYGASKWVRLTDPPSAAAAVRAARDLPGGAIDHWAFLVTALARVSFGAAELVLIMAIGLLYRLNGLVLQRWAPDLTEVEHPRSEDAIVYLRNFADDAVTLRAGAYTRTPLLQVIFDVLVPVRQRPFEQVLAGLLWRFGPVIAAADPQRRALRASSVLTASLSHSTWRVDVIAWCRAAHAIVVSATPTRVNDGLREELRLLSDAIDHERIVLVVGPGTIEEVRTRFALFRSAFPPGSKLLDGLDDPRITDGTLALVRVPGHGWDAWGARRRTESAYAVALDEAIAHGRQVWLHQTNDRHDEHTPRTSPPTPRQPTTDLPVPGPATPTAAPVGVPSNDLTVGEWTRTGTLGIFVQTVHGTRTGATRLADPTRPLTEQIAHVRSLHWLPADRRESECGRLRTLGTGPHRPIVDGMLDSPIAFPCLAVVGPTPLDAPDLVTYLWPAVGADLRPTFAEDEAVLLEWPTERPLRYAVRDDLSSDYEGHLLVPESVAHHARWTLTNHRLVLCTRGRSREDVGVMHVRLEWMTHVITERYVYPTGRHPSTRSVSVVFDVGHGERARVRLDPGEAAGPQRETALAALRSALGEHGLTDAAVRSDHHDHGRKGSLTRDYFEVGRGSFGLPAHLFAL